MVRHFYSKETGKRVTRVELVESFEKEFGPLTSEAFQALLMEVEFYEQFGYWRGEGEHE